MFERLTLDDLCVFSRTCRRLQILAQQHFQRKYRSEANTKVKVAIGLNGKLRVTPLQNYVKCFQKFITNICIVSYEQEEDEESTEDESTDDESADERIQSMSKVVNFMKRKCNKNIHGICVWGDIALDPFCKKIKKILRNAKTVTFTERNQSGVDEATFLSHCSNVTTLILEDGIPTRNCNAIFQQKYRKLEHFYFIRSYGSDLRIDNLKAFFRHHPTIITVAWIFHFEDHEDGALKCLQIVDYIINLEHMFLHIDRLLADDFHTICSYLNVLCNRHNFQCLEIEFEGQRGAAALKANSNFLANWKQITMIHVTCMRLTEVIPALQSLTYLRTLVLTDLTLEEVWNDHFGLDDLVAIVDNTRNIDLPFIEEVHFVDIDDEHMYIYILWFVSHWRKLKRIFVPASIYSDVVFHNSMLAKLSQQRRKLRNSCELTIFTNHKGNTTNLSHDLVKVKLVEFTLHPFRKYVTVNDCK